MIIVVQLLRVPAQVLSVSSDLTLVLNSKARFGFVEAMDRLKREGTQGKKIFRGMMYPLMYLKTKFTRHKITKSICFNVNVNTR